MPFSANTEVAVSRICWRRADEFVRAFAGIAVGVVTIGFGAVRHQRMDNLQIGAAGLGLMAGGLFVTHGTPEALLTVCGVSLVALAHLRNLKLLD